MLMIFPSWVTAQVDLVTETDKQCEKKVFDMLREAFPDHAFIGAAACLSPLQWSPAWWDAVTHAMQHPVIAAELRVSSRTVSACSAGEEGSAKQGFTAALTDAPTWLVDPVVRAIPRPSMVT